MPTLPFLYGQGVPGGLAERLDEEASPKPGIQPRVTDVPMPEGKQLTVNDIAELEGTAGSTAANRDMTSGVNAQELLTGIVAPYLPSRPAGAGAAVSPQLEDYSKIQGQEGKDLYNETYRTIPQDMSVSQRLIGQAQEQEAQGTANWLTGEQLRQQKQMAIMREDQLRREQEVQARQAKLDQAVQYYSNDLADQGKYWRKPGSLLAAFGAALVAGGSPGDPSVGLRTIEHAVAQDFSERKALADMHLGELRSNLAAYRQFMGDKNAGDMLAFSEANRVAGMELKRIAAQFQGPIARERANMISDELMMKANEGRIRAYQAAVLEMPKLENPLIQKERQAVGAALPGVGPTPLKGSWKPGMTGLAAPTTQADVAKSAQAVKSSGGSGDALFTGKSSGPSGGIGWLSPETKKVLEERVPGITDRVAAVRMSVVKSLAAKAGGDPTKIDVRMTDAQVADVVRTTGGNVAKFNKDRAEYVDKLAEDKKEIGSQAHPIAARLNSYRQLGHDIQVMQAVADSKYGGDVDKLLNPRTSQVIGAANVKKIAEWLAAGSKPTEEHERLARDVQSSVNNFKQLLAGNVVEWTHEKFGGAVSEGEQKAKDEFIKTDHSWEAIKNFQRNISEGAQAQMKAILGQAKSNLTRMEWEVYMGQGSQPMPFQGIKGYTGPRSSKEVQSVKPQSVNASMPGQEPETPFSSSPASRMMLSPAALQAIERLKSGR
jgi:hypothetical protein